MPDFGDKPELAWLPVDKLTVDRTYQRSIESRRSQTLIQKIADNFRWPRFGCVMAVKAGDGWQIVDGQHRTEGARRAGVTEVPAVILPYNDAKAAARDFIAINRDRVTMNAQAVYHAQVKAGDPEACAIARVCARAGITIPKYPKQANQMSAGETLAVGTIAKVCVRLGEDAAATILHAVATAVAGRAGDLRAGIIEASAALYDDGHDAERIAGVLSDGGVSDVLRMAPVRRENGLNDRIRAEIEARLEGKGSKERDCLTCGTEFVSSGPGNRMCDRCRRTRS